MTRVVNNCSPTRACIILIIKANIFLFLVLQTFGKKIRAGGGGKKEIKLSIFSSPEQNAGV